MNRVDWDRSSHTERMTPCIGVRAAYRNSIASTANANTEKATLLGQNNHEFQVVITGSSLYSCGCFSHTVTGHQDEVRAHCVRSAANCAALGPKSSSLYVYKYTWWFYGSVASYPAAPPSRCHTDRESQAPSRSFCLCLNVYAREAAHHGIPDPTESIIHAV